MGKCYNKCRGTGCPFNITGEEEDATKEMYKHFFDSDTNVSTHSTRIVKQRPVSTTDKDITRFTGWNPKLEKSDEKEKCKF